MQCVEYYVCVSLFAVCRKGWLGVGYVCCMSDKCAMCRVSYLCVSLFAVCRKGWLGVGYVCCTWDKCAMCRVSCV